MAEIPGGIDLLNLVRESEGLPPLELDPNNPEDVLELQEEWRRQNAAASGMSRLEFIRKIGKGTGKMPEQKTTTEFLNPGVRAALAEIISQAEASNRRGILQSPNESLHPETESDRLQRVMRGGGDVDFGDVRNPIVALQALLRASRMIEGGAAPGVGDIGKNLPGMGYAPQENPETPAVGREHPDDWLRMNRELLQLLLHKQDK